MKKVAIVQSNYIPLKGYFDLINVVDEFILFDDMQYTRRDWRNRNLIKTADGPKWLTIPVAVKGNYWQKIKDTTVSNRDGQGNTGPRSSTTIRGQVVLVCTVNCLSTCISVCRKHLYRVSTIFSYRQFARHLGSAPGLPGPKTIFVDEGKTERLVSLSRQAGASVYISGPAARDYIDEEHIKAENIELQYMDYSSYPEYRQLSPPFEHRVSVIDLIFNEGPEATKYMKSFSR